MKCEKRYRRLWRLLPVALLACAHLPPEARVVAEAQWRQDLDSLVEVLERKHPNPWHAVSRERFREELYAPVPPAPSPALQAEARAARLAAALALLAEGHTVLSDRELPTRLLPFFLARFAEGYFVQSAYAAPAADRAALDLVGGRLRRLNGLEMTEVVERLRRFVAQESPGWTAEVLAAALTQSHLLVAAGVVGVDQSEVAVEVERGGELLERKVAFVPRDAWRAAGVEVRNAFQVAGVSPAPTLAGQRGPYWFESIPEKGVIFAQYNACAEAPGQTFAQFTEALFAAVARDAPRRLILDLRANSGGNSGLFSDQLLPRLRASSLNAPGGIAVLIGPRVFSSGVFAVAELQRETRAVLVGEPTGQGGNHYGMVEELELANTGIRLWFSTRLWKLVEVDAPEIAPDVSVPHRAQAILAGQDPAFEAAVEYRP